MRWWPRMGGLLEVVCLRLFESGGWEEVGEGRGDWVSGWLIVCLMMMAGWVVDGMDVVGGSGEVGWDGIGWMEWDDGELRAWVGGRI